VLAEDVSAVSALPSFDNSGMDGYAVRVEDVAAATEEKPVTLPVTAEVAAGDDRGVRAPARHRHQDHDRGDAAARRRGRGAGGVDRRRRAPG
jgi:Molybdopterin biosynthesis enzyme